MFMVIMMNGKIFAIGDIHGCLDKLENLMKQIPADFGRDRIVFLGDYIDRGPDSFGVVEYLIALQEKHPETFIFLKGNHEEMLELYLAGMDRSLYLSNGGLQTLESYMAQESLEDGPPIPESHLSFFASLLPYYETDKYIFVHAGLKPGVPVYEQKSEDLFWTRTAFIESDYSFGRLVIFGHTPFVKPLIHPNKIGIDTGAVYGYQLTCVELPDMIFYHA